ncbi:MerR family transcriptional regulator [bacterium]|nr:MerR family transcriptional regulator [bacterium]
MSTSLKNGHYRAKTLAAAAGISTNLLRAWERRYDLFEPERRASGHRLYTEKDLQVIRRIRELVDSGLSIGEVAALGRTALLEQPQPVFAPGPGVLELATLDEQRQQSIAELAPRDLLPQRATRYAGENLGVSLRLLHSSDLALVYRLYRTLKGLYEIWIYMEQRLARPILLGRLGVLFEKGFEAELKLLGAATGPQEPGLRNALEDTRGGALSVILDYCRGRELEQLNSTDLNVLLTLARDHAKMMRNAFYDLDDPLREADETLKAHSLRPVLQKLQAFYAGRAEFRAGSNYQGPISSRCLETSALDRITYGFLARAIGSAGCSAGLWVVQINEHLCRWAFECSVDRFSPFEPHELPVLAVAQAMGVSPEEAISYAYLGSARRAGRLWAWFHWPVYHPPKDVPHCLCEPLGGAHSHHLK